MPWNPDTVCLAKGEIYATEVAPAMLVCRRGKLWITQTGVDRDVVLASGQSFRPQDTGLLVVEALEAACLGATNRRPVNQRPVRQEPFLWKH